MGHIQISASSKLIIGLIYCKDHIKDKTLAVLKRRFGELDFVSQVLNFDYTDYYYSEIGQPLRRLFVSFRDLRREDSLPKIKIYTNKLEKHYSIKGKRQINIDPGFLSLGKLILATTKDQQHRIYLSKGIFAEVTLFFNDGTFKPWDWTYPDYKTKEYIDIFNSIRNIHLQDIRKNVSQLSKSI